MARKPTGNPNGRPRAKIDQKEFEKLCELQCTIGEVCGFFDVQDDTLNRWCKDTYGATFSEVYKSKSQGGKISLRRTQFRLSEKSAAMAIWLGKQYLGQRDTDIVTVQSNGVLESLLELKKNHGVEREAEGGDSGAV